MKPGRVSIGHFLGLFKKGKSMFSISTNEELYSGQFETEQEAIKEAVGSGYEVFWIGECVPPIQPEECWDAGDWLEVVSGNEDYCGEWAEDWDDSTKEQREELEQEVKKVMGAWLDRHKLRPRFFNIGNDHKYQMRDGIPVLID